ncbi:Six-hairpin glycosidase-like protein [Peziza echinospora]|nr:Six-hairpin glycosidase-like protein [Peziza echinospora]
MPRLLSYVILTGGFLTTLSLSAHIPSQVILDNKPTKFTNKDLEEWIAYERMFSLHQILDNIGPDGANATGTAPGCILASPSKQAPDYFYQWVRDGAITISSLLDQWEFGRWKKEDEEKILDTWLQMFLNYVDMQGKLQTVQNPSGGFFDGGLGEPKFRVDGTAFARSWGRPQRDGPALRASALASFLKKAKQIRPDILQNADFLRRLYDDRLPARSIIKADLEYVSHSWHAYGFDAWEEVNGLHFFTAMVQLKAMADGADIATHFNDPGAAEWYSKQQKSLSDFVWKFWDSKKGHLVSTLDIEHRTGLNCDLLLGSLHGDRISFPPWSDELLVSMDRLIAQMAVLHPNKTPSKDGKRKGVGIGRYTEDIYDGAGFDGGNAWFICTASVAHVLYASISEFIEKQTLAITDRNFEFFHSINPQLERKHQMLYADSDYLFNATMQWMFEFGDSFLEVVKAHATPQGRLSEQFDTKTGKQHGAEDLTWSYGSFLSALEERDRAKRLLFGKSA